MIEKNEVKVYCSGFCVLYVFTQLEVGANEKAKDFLINKNVFFETSDKWEGANTA